MEVIVKCPICDCPDNTFFLKCTDFTVSHEEFSIVACNSCSFKFTSPRPSDSLIGKYYMDENYVSHSDTKKGIVNKIYHLVKSYALIKKLQLVMHFCKPKGTIIDYGCGSGSFLNTCKNNGWNAIGFEPSDDARKRIIEKYSLSAFSNSTQIINHLNGEKTDCITLWHVLEHVGDINGLFAFFNNTLANKGKIFIAVPNCNSFDAKFYKEHWAAYDVPRHFYHFNPSNIRQLFTKNGYRCVKTLPMIFDSFYVSLLSEKYLGNKLGFIRAFFIGLISNLKAIKTGEEFSSQIYIFEKE